MSSRRVICCLAAAAAVGLLGACADGAGAPDATGSASPPTASPTAGPSATPSPTSPGTPLETAHPPMPTVSPPPGSGRTITGEVVEGVEAGCLLLRTAGMDYLLLNSGNEITTGNTVTVRGYADPDLMTTCQQGTPFIVLEVVSP